MTPRIACQIVVRLLFGLLLLQALTNAAMQVALMRITEVPEGTPNAILGMLPVMGFIILTLIAISFAAPLFAFGLPDQKLDVSLTAGEATRIGLILVGAILVVNGVVSFAELAPFSVDDSFKVNAVGAGLKLVFGVIVIGAHHPIARLLMPDEKVRTKSVG